MNAPDEKDMVVSIGFGFLTFLVIAGIYAGVGFFTGIFGADGASADWESMFYKMVIAVPLSGIFSCAGMLAFRTNRRRKALELSSHEAADET